MNYHTTLDLAEMFALRWMAADEPEREKLRSEAQSHSEEMAYEIVEALVRLRAPA